MFIYLNNFFCFLIFPTLSVLPRFMLIRVTYVSVVQILDRSIIINKKCPELIFQFSSEDLNLEMKISFSRKVIAQLLENIEIMIDLLWSLFWIWKGVEPKHKINVHIQWLKTEFWKYNHMHSNVALPAFPKCLLSVRRLANWQLDCNLEIMKHREKNIGTNDVII